MRPTPTCRPLAVIVLGTLALAASPGRAAGWLYENALQGTAWVVDEDGATPRGSGVLVDRERRLVLTNFHVVTGRTQVRVYFPVADDGELVSDPAYYVENADRLAVAGQVVRTDPRRDLALVRLAALPEAARALPLAGGSPRPGQTVHSVGNSGVEPDGGALAGALWRYSKGEVRQVYRQNRRGAPFQGYVVETQVPSNPGDSGGPVVNDRGELVAVTRGGLRQQQLVTFGIDVREIRAFLGHGAGAAEEADGPAGDPRLEDALDQAGLKYRVLAGGTFELRYLMTDKGTHAVYVESRVTRPAGYGVREVWSPVLESATPFAEELTAKLRTLNARTRLGSWQTLKVKGNRYLLLFCAQCPADAEAGAVKRLALRVVRAAYRMKTGGLLERPTEADGPGR